MHLMHTSCADPESFVRGGPALTFFFIFFFKLRLILFRWWDDDGQTLNAGLVAL